jgi:hypothetical protein
MVEAGLGAKLENSLLADFDGIAFPKYSLAPGGAAFVLPIEMACCTTVFGAKKYNDAKKTIPAVVIPARSQPARLGLGFSEFITV